MNIIEQFDHPFEFHLSDEVNPVRGQDSHLSCSLVSVGLALDGASCQRRHLALIIDGAVNPQQDWQEVLAGLQDIFSRLRTYDLVSVIWAGVEPLTLCAGGTPDEGWRAVRAAGMLRPAGHTDLPGAWLTGVAVVAQRFFPDGRSRVLIVSSGSALREPGYVSAIADKAGEFRSCGIITDVMTGESGDDPLTTVAAAGGGNVLTTGQSGLPPVDQENQGPAVTDIRVRPMSRSLGWERVESLRGRTGLGTALKFAGLSAGERHSFLISRPAPFSPHAVVFEIEWKSSDFEHCRAQVRLRPGDSGLAEFADAPAAVAVYKAGLVLEQAFAEPLPGMEIRSRLREVIRTLEPFSSDRRADCQMRLAGALLHRGVETA
jgi:hypothetical protein